MAREMKDSGIEWIGEIPLSWDIKRGKNILTLLERTVLDDDGVITCFRDGEVTLRRNRREDGFTMSDKEIGYQGIEVGDLVVHGMDGFAGAIGISDSRGKATPVLNVLDSSQNKRFLMYYLRCAARCGLFLSLSTGIRVRSCDTNWNKLKNVQFILPPISEQERIVLFLDTECTRINAVIEQTRASIEEYKKLKQAVITQAVTKGIRSDRQMKDSRIEWIGGIPEDWHVEKIKKVASFHNGDRSSNYPSGEDIVSEGILFVTSNNLGRIILNTDIDTNKFITHEKYNMMRGAKLHIDDIVFCLRGSVGKCSLNKVYTEGTIASSLVVIRPFGIMPEYLNYILQTPIITKMASLEAIGIGSQNLAAEDIADFRIPIPNPEDAKNIVSYLDEKTIGIEKHIELIEERIRLLEEYKKSLIYEYVTGKKEVPA